MTPQVRRTLTSWNALLQADLTTLSKSWVVRIWLLVLLMSFLVVPVAQLGGNRQTPIAASTVFALYLGIFLNVWSMVIIVLSAGSVSLEADIIADGILSRACTRTQYILAKLTARALAIGGIYLLGACAAGYASWRYGTNDMTCATIFAGIAIVGLALLMLVSLGVTMSVIFNNTIVSVIAMLLLWYVAGSIFAFAGADYLSPASLTRRLPQILRDSTGPQVTSCSATKTSVAVVFSKKVSQTSAERVGNYTVKSSGGTEYRPQTAVYDPETRTAMLKGFTLPEGKRMTVTVEGVTDTAGNVISPAANSALSRPVPSTKTNSDEKTAHSTEKSHAKSSAKTGTKAKKPAASQHASSRHRRYDPPRVTRVEATGNSVTVAFSQDMDPADVETPANYTVESPLGVTHAPKTATYNASAHTVILSGFLFKTGDLVKVTAKDVTSRHDVKISSRHNSATFSEVENWKYCVGFGLSALLFAMVGVIWFSWRDL